MEKLLKLLNEYSPDYCKDYPEGNLDSLKFLRGFIKWLVDNDKIDLEIALLGIESNDQIEYAPDEELLMILAIQDIPIEYLICVLK